MQMKMKTLSVAVLAAVILLAAGCGKKQVTAAPPPPPAAAPPPAAPPPPPPPKPAAARIDTFTIEPTSIQSGQSATLRWTVANASDISIDQGVGAVQANGSRQVSPNSSTTYTLTARGAANTDTRTATLNVIAPPPPPPPPPPPKVTISGADMLGREAQDALFDYDMSDIRADAQRALMADADLLKRIFAADPTFNVVIEGHCDERGSAEYNLGLGDRRATTARDFLVMLGVPANRISTISYGKEKPVCTEADEACYQRNRRAHLTPAR